VVVVGSVVVVVGSVVVVVWVEFPPVEESCGSDPGPVVSNEQAVITTAAPIAATARRGSPFTG
jgi:hypothetical protein